jgi:alkylation response protein AidB-like acyl-CoA dehydrogenase
MGLAGTGSKTAVGNDVFVPAHRVVLIGDLLAGTTPGSTIHGNPIYRQSMLSSLPFALVAPVLGMAEGTLADFIEMAKVRTTRGRLPAVTIAWRDLRPFKAAWPRRPAASKRRG